MRQATLRYLGCPELHDATRVSFMGYGTLDTMLVADADSTVDLQIWGMKASCRRRRWWEAPQTEPFAVEPGIMRVPTGMLQRLPWCGAPGDRTSCTHCAGLPECSGLAPAQRAGDTWERTGHPYTSWDGAPIYHPGHAFSIVSTFQSEAFRMYGCIRGSFPADTGAPLGCAGCGLKDASHRDEIAGSAAVGIVSGRLLVEAPLNEKTSIMVAVRRSYLDRIVRHCSASTQRWGGRTNAQHRVLTFWMSPTR